jgi:Ca2+-binding RTX toxin-like protein
MAVINFSTLADGAKFKLGGDNLVFDGGISAADVSIAELGNGVELSVGAKSILLKNWTIGNLNSAQVTFNNGSELMVGDTLFGLAGDNNANMLEPFFPGNENRDQLRGMGGDDELTGGEGDDLLFGQGGNDTLNGQGDADWLDGGKGNDTLNGGDDKDILKGFSGDDIIVGGAGADRLDGGSGADTFQITAADSPNGAGLFDKVVEFISGSDRFDLDVAGTADNYIEKRLKTDAYADALTKATELLVANDGLKDYVFIAGNSKGWLFGEFSGDMTFDLAIEILNGNGLGKLDFSDII